jgi:predicted membrane protein
MQRQRGLGYAAALVGGSTLAGPYVQPEWFLALVVILYALILWRFFDTRYLTYTFCILAALYGIGLLPFFVFATTLAMLVLGELVFRSRADDLNTYFY